MNSNKYEVTPAHNFNIQTGQYLPAGFKSSTMNELGSTSTDCQSLLGNSSWTETPGIRLAPGVWTDCETVLKGPVNRRELGFLLAFQQRAPGFVLPFRINCSPQPILPDVTNTGSIAFPLMPGQDPTYNYLRSTFMPHGDLFQYVQNHPLDLHTQITFVLDLLPPSENY